MSSKDYAVMPYSDYVGACDAIREKDGSSAPIKSGDLRSKILGIETGADVSVVTATAPDVLGGRIFVDKDGNPLPGTMPNRGSGGGTISSVAQSVALPEGYYNGIGEVSISAAEQAKIIESNIAEGITLLGKTGTYAGKFACGTNTWGGAASGNPRTFTLSGLPFRPKVVTYSAPRVADTISFNFLFIDTINGINKLGYMTANATKVTTITKANSYFDWGITDDGFYLTVKSTSAILYSAGSAEKPWVCIG